MDPPDVAAVSAVRIRSRGNVLASMVLAAAPKRSMDGRAWNLGGRKGSSQGRLNIPAGQFLSQPTELESSESSKPFELQEQESAKRREQSAEFKGILKHVNEQEFQAKKSVQQAAFSARGIKNDRRHQRKTERSGKGKNGPEHHGKQRKPNDAKPGTNKRKLKDMATAIKSPAWIAAARAKLKNRLFSASTLASKESKRRRIQEIMDNCNIRLGENGITTDELVTIAAVLGETAIKSADQYLAEVKLMQLEAGVSWTDVLDRQLTMVKRALKRDTGPEERAKEFNPELMDNGAWETKLQVKGWPTRTAWAYGWAVVWMLRCIELVNLQAADVALDFSTKLVTVNIRKSKMDQAAHGVKRTLKCCGNPTCTRLCPWGLAIRVLSDHASPSETTPLFPDKDGTQIQKVKMVKSWMDNINEELTGHSARRSGAMWYARKGLPVHEIGLLGRWKSSAVFRYIEEALQEIPLNTNVMATTTGAQDRQMICPGTPVPGTPVANVAKFQEVQEDKEPAPQTRKAKKPEPPEQCWAVSTGRKGRTSHRVRRASWNLSLASWDTWCGWHFAEKNVKVTLSPKLLASTSQCKRCEAAYQSRDGVKDEVSLASLVNFD